ncbi:MAG: gamma-glutamylcyclotransferase family protein [Candidatus Eiseniibacteriota bacterium]
MNDYTERTLPLYFAYGSNLEPEQMEMRCPGYRLLCRAILHDHVLRFQGHSRIWGGAIATIEHTPGAMVHGVVFELAPDQFNALDRSEGCVAPGHPDNQYDRVQLPVQLEYGEWIQVFTYIMRPQTPGRPSRSYRWAILKGMRHYSLPITAIEALEAEPTVD